MAPIIYKCQKFNKRDNEKRQSFKEEESDGNGDRFVSLSPIALFLPFQNESYCLSDLGEEIRSLTHLI